MSKLKESDILEIRNLLSASVSENFIADAFGVTRRTINYIKNNKVWKHI